MFVSIVDYYFLSDDSDLSIILAEMPASDQHDVHILRKVFLKPCMSFPRLVGIAIRTRDLSE